MNARTEWLRFAHSDEGRELAAALDAAEDDQLCRQADVDKKIKAVFRRLDRQLREQHEREKFEVTVTAEYACGHVDLRLRMPTEAVIELGDAWGHYCDHGCGHAAKYLDRFCGSLVDGMMRSIPMEVLDVYIEDDEDEA